MDKKDRQIIAALQKEGRLTNQELSERVNLSPSPCLRRLRLLEDAGIIRGYTAIVDEEAYGLPVTAFVHIRLQQHSREVVSTFENRIRAIDAILDCYVLTGEADYLLRVLVESLQDYEQFVRGQLHAIPGIAAIDTSFAYGVVKRSTVFPAWDENKRSTARRREKPSTR
ncbi:DNA-binding transcriptional activator DecR [Ralstonia wenshanensis]|uniref:Lrp/AsnC family transcriptional regulator n=1 Tax=Ralstonia wenshanensis TaxID=2842456 RepID=UPI0028F54380|nr:Lrp/AsnC family transcriptional regulator [Ralstonia wenshanensis]CAJ0809775.1 DNA-binding transcriptional activator DecR [Ralstonia wenshanensis]